MHWHVFCLSHWVSVPLDNIRFLSFSVLVTTCSCLLIYKLQFCLVIFAVLLQSCTVLVILVCTFLAVSRLFFVGSVIWFILDYLHYVRYLHSVYTVLAILYNFPAFVDWNAFTAIFLHIISITSTSGAKAVVIIVLSTKIPKFKVPKFWWFDNTSRFPIKNILKFLQLDNAIDSIVTTISCK